MTALRHDQKGKLTRFQTDACLSPGSSGGPIVNAQGELVGVVFAGVSGASGLGFAVSPNLIREFVSRRSVDVDFSPMVVLSPPMPIQVTITPILVDLAPEVGRIFFTGEGIPSVDFGLSATSHGLTGTIVVPSRVHDGPFPEAYTVTIVLEDSKGTEIRRGFKLDVIPKDVAKLLSQREPAQMMEDRKVLSHELDLADFSRDDGRRGSVGAGISDFAKGVHLQRNPTGSVVIDNRAVEEIGQVQIDSSLFRFLQDLDQRELAEDFERLRRESTRLHTVWEKALRDPNLRYFKDKAYKAWQDARRKMDQAGQKLNSFHIVLCTESGEYFSSQVYTKNLAPCSPWQRIR